MTEQGGPQQDARKPIWVNVKAKVNGRPIELSVDLAWDEMAPEDRPDLLVDFGYDFWPPGPAGRGRVLTRIFARRACNAVARAAERSFRGGVLIGTHLGLGEIGTLVGIQRGPENDELANVVEYEKLMKTAWPWRAPAYVMDLTEWSRFERLATIARQATRPGQQE